MVSQFTALRGRARKSASSSTRMVAATVVSTLALSISSASFGQSADDAAAERYAALLEEISNLELTLAHKEAQLATQRAEIESLQAQIDSVDDTSEAIGPMLDKMKTSIEAEIESDLPFNQGERFDRLAGLELSLIHI